MKLAQHLLRRWIAIPDDARALRLLLDDLGLEVKRSEATPDGAVYTLELLANRGDHRCYLGVAREIRGRTGAEIMVPGITTLQVGKSPFQLRNSTPLCLRYTLTLLERTGAPAPLAEDALQALHAAGLHSVSAPVDATNLSNLEFGQPTHAFDAEKVDQYIEIRLSRPGERAWPLFQPGPVDLPAGTLVIADAVKILAIAGVIGCEESKTTADTRRVLLESATFDPVAVRKASRALNLHTDASARFERGADPSFPEVGAGRVVHLLEQTGAWRRVGETGAVGDWTDPGRVIAIHADAANRFLATDLSADEIATRLGWMGFDVSPELAVRVPPHRLWDVEYPADLYEELAKSLGYNQTPLQLPDAGLGALPTPSQRVTATVADVLVSQGFYEVITDGFYGRAAFDRLGLAADHPLQAHVETLNALDRGYSLCKNNALVQAVEAAASNLRRKVDQIRIFEYTRTFHPDTTAKNKVCSERGVLWALCCGEDRDRAWDLRPRAADAWFLSGLVDEIGAALGLPLRVGPVDPGAPLAPALHPGRRASVTLHGQPVGLLGEVHPSVVRAFGVKRERPCYLELDLTALLGAPEKAPFVEPSPYMPVDRSLAFTLPHRVPAASVAGILREAGPAWLMDVAMVDLYAHEDEGRPVRTVTYALRFAQGAQSRSADEINGALRDLIAAVQTQAGAQGVRLRA